MINDPIYWAILIAGFVLMMILDTALGR